MQKIRGLTTIELMIALVIAAVLVSMGGPSFMRLIRSNSMSGAVNTFMADLRYARSEAVRRGGRVVVCRSAAPEATSPTCATAADVTNGWATGWLIFEDRDNDSTFNTGDNLLRVQAPVKNVENIAEATSTTVTLFKFTATGRLLDNTSSAGLLFGGTNFTSDLKRRVCISPGGRARIAGNASTSCGTSNE
jgi:type IV fimbrial biogenesis protein FimT